MLVRWKGRYLGLRFSRGVIPRRSFNRGFLEAVNVAIIHFNKENDAVVADKSVWPFPALGCLAIYANFLFVRQVERRGWLFGVLYYLEARLVKVFLFPFLKRQSWL